MGFSQSEITIRVAQSVDSDRIAYLCDQLGYVVSTEQAQQRLDQLLQDSPNHVIYVAETASNRLIGWIHLYICQLLTNDRMGVVGGLVVDAGFRQQGIGKLLLNTARVWAEIHGCRELLVRSNVRRQAAHQFYQRSGFEEVKRSVVFHQPLEH